MRRNARARRRCFFLFLQSVVGGVGGGQGQAAAADVVAADAGGVEEAIEFLKESSFFTIDVFLFC